MNNFTNELITIDKSKDDMKMVRVFLTVTDDYEMQKIGDMIEGYISFAKFLLIPLSISPTGKQFLLLIYNVKDIDLVKNKLKEMDTALSDILICGSIIHDNSNRYSLEPTNIGTNSYYIIGYIYENDMRKYFISCNTSIDTCLQMIVSRFKDSDKTIFLKEGFSAKDRAITEKLDYNIKDMVLLNDERIIISNTKAFQLKNIPITSMPCTHTVCILNSFEKHDPFVCSLPEKIKQISFFRENKMKKRENNYQYNLMRIPYYYNSRHIFVPLFLDMNKNIEIIKLCFCEYYEQLLKSTQNLIINGVTAQELDLEGVINNFEKNIIKTKQENFRRTKLEILYSIENIEKIIKKRKIAILEYNETISNIKQFPDMIVPENPKKTTVDLLLEILDIKDGKYILKEKENE